MEITYQLFTDLQPPKRVISSIDTTKLHYFDLVNMICQQERNQLGDSVRVVPSMNISNIGKIAYFAV